MRAQLKAARNVLRPLAPVLIFGLDIAARCSFALSRGVGWVYLKLWPIFGIHWYDHAFDHLLTPGCNRWTERGVLANRYIKPGDVVLDVGCGDGSLSGDYYSRNASQVDAFDLDERAIGNARRKHAKPNVAFTVADATRIPILPRKYDVIVFFAVIEHLSEDEASKLLQTLGRALKPEGAVIGCTLFIGSSGPDEVHRNKFSSVPELQRFLGLHFDSTDLWCSNWPDRVDCYFECRMPKLGSEHGTLESPACHESVSVGMTS